MAASSVARPQEDSGGQKSSGWEFHGTAGEFFGAIRRAHEVAPRIVEDRVSFGPKIEADLTALGARLEQIADAESSRLFVALKDRIEAYLHNLALDAEDLANEPLLAVTAASAPAAGSSG